MDSTEKEISSTESLEPNKKLKIDSTTNDAEKPNLTNEQTKNDVKENGKNMRAELEGNSHIDNCSDSENNQEGYSEDYLSENVEHPGILNEASKNSENSKYSYSEEDESFDDSGIGETNESQLPQETNENPSEKQSIIEENTESILHTNHQSGELKRPLNLEQIPNRPSSNYNQGQHGMIPNSSHILHLQHGKTSYFPSHQGMQMGHTRQGPGMRVPPHLMPGHSRQDFKNEQNRPITENKPSPDDADLTDAMVFLNRIKEEYSPEPHVYDRFLEAMRDFKFGKIDADEVCRVIRQLFKDKQHLIASFDEYLPYHLKFSNDSKDTYRQPSMPQKNVERYIPNTHPAMHDVRQNIQPDHRPISSVPIQPQGPPILHDHSRKVPEYRPIHPDPRIMHDARIQPTPYDERMGFPTYRPQPIYHQQQHHNIHYGGYPYGRSPPRYPSVTPHFPAENRFRSTPPNTAIHLERKESDRSMGINNQKLFIDRLKQKYRPNDRVYIAAIDALANSNLTIDDLKKQMKVILIDDRELFNEYLKCCDYEGRETTLHKENKVLTNIKNIMSEKGLLEDFSKMINFYNQNYISGSKLFTLLGKIIGSDELGELKRYLSYNEETDHLEVSKYENCEKIGSYIVLKENARTYDCPELSRNVLNDRYVSVSTHLSEDDVYVFRQKNTSEEYLIRMGDDRSEFNVIICRLKYLICKLNKLSSLLPENPHELELKDIEMSPGVLKETLKLIYGEESSTILEKILNSPKNAISKVLKRCYSVYREFSKKQRENRFHWRIATESHYYKAYDIDGIEYKNAERNNLHFKNIQAMSSAPVIKQVGDRKTTDLITELFDLYVQNNYNPSKKHTALEKSEYFRRVIEVYSNEEFSFTVDVDFYLLYYLLSLICERFEEIEHLEVPIEPVSKVALSLKLVEDSAYTTMFDGVISLSRHVMSKVIDSDTYEEQIRIITQSKGFKLYNLKKIMGKISKLITSIMERGDGASSSSEFLIYKKDGILTLCQAENSVTHHQPDLGNCEAVE